VIIAELGIDMSRFPSVSQLACWAGVSPGGNEIQRVLGLLSPFGKQR
jgi:hypothetical protein